MRSYVSLSDEFFHMGLSTNTIRYLQCFNTVNGIIRCEMNEPVY